MACACVTMDTCVIVGNMYAAGIRVLSLFISALQNLKTIQHWHE